MLIILFQSLVNHSILNLFYFLLYLLILKKYKNKPAVLKCEELAIHKEETKRVNAKTSFHFNIVELLLWS